SDLVDKCFGYNWDRRIDPHPASVGPDVSVVDRLIVLEDGCQPLGPASGDSCCETCFPAVNELFHDYSSRFSFEFSLNCGFSLSSLPGSRCPPSRSKPVSLNHPRRTHPVQRFLPGGRVCGNFPAGCWNIVS